MVAIILYGDTAHVVHKVNLCSIHHGMRLSSLMIINNTTQFIFIK